MPTELIHELAAFRAACSQARAGGARLGLVPTMGALHEGHLALVQEARRRGAQKVALTIFVNPLQFGPNEDFDRYPRTLESDLARCQEAGVELVFAPERRAMYPDDFATNVRITGVTERLEGAHRPGHFDGVTTVVAKLFGLTGECVAVFGRKDYQQWRVLDRLARDLDLPVEVVGMPTVREADGLALSSRNRYLSEEQRARALSIARGLRAAHAAFAGGIRNSAALAARVRAEMEPSFDSIDYVAAADPDTLAEAPSIATDRLLLVVAARIGGTRLIDNTVLGQDAPPGVAA